MGIFKTTISGFPKYSKDKQQAFLECLIALILITLPLKNIFVSIATISLVITSVFLIKSQGFNFKRAYFIPILGWIILIIYGTIKWKKGNMNT